MFAALMWTDALYYTPSYQGPLSNATGGGDLSWLLGIVVAGVIYWVLSFRSIPKEVSEAEAVAARAAARVAR
jgi:cytosine/uracil/thiamine/allantoin permease